MNKLVVREFVVGENPKDRQLEEGEKYSCFQDPETKKYYRPVKDFEVTGNNLEDKFIELLEK